MLTLSVLARSRYVEVEIVDRRSARGDGGGLDDPLPATGSDGSGDRGQDTHGDPAAMKVKAGIVTGEITEMKVTERVEQGSDRVVSPREAHGEGRAEE
jgi:hypothetical protein